MKNGLFLFFCLASHHVVSVFPRQKRAWSVALILPCVFENPFVSHGDHSAVQNAWLLSRLKNVVALVFVLMKRSAACCRCFSFSFQPASGRLDDFFVLLLFVCAAAEQQNQPPRRPPRPTTLTLRLYNLSPLPGTRACVFERIPLEKCCSNIWLLMCPVLYFSAFKPTSNMMK